jgi:hypothetical protein
VDDERHDDGEYQADDVGNQHNAVDVGFAGSDSTGEIAGAPRDCSGKREQGNNGGGGHEHPE